jgi:hypothetical protein
VRTTILIAVAMACVSSTAAAEHGLKVLSDARFGITFAIPSGWTAIASSTYQVVARGAQGGLGTQVAIRSGAARAVQDYFLTPGEGGVVHVIGSWACASSRSWHLNQSMRVVVCAEDMRNGNALVVTFMAEKAWLRKAGGEAFVRSLVSKIRGFRAEDD